MSEQIQSTLRALSSTDPCSKVIGIFTYSLLVSPFAKLTPSICILGPISTFAFTAFTRSLETSVTSLQGSRRRLTSRFKDLAERIGNILCGELGIEPFDFRIVIILSGNASSEASLSSISFDAHSTESVKLT